MGEQREAFVGIDVAKGRNAIAVADGERGGEVRYLGAVDASPAGMTRIMRRLAEKYEIPSLRCFDSHIVVKSAVS